MTSGAIPSSNHIHSYNNLRCYKLQSRSSCAILIQSHTSLHLTLQQRVAGVPEVEGALEQSTGHHGGSVSGQRVVSVLVDVEMSEWQR